MYWIYAITALCHLMNVEEITGSSAWFRLHGEHFNCEKIPFGALVDFKPSDARGDKRERSLNQKGKLVFLLVTSFAGVEQKFHLDYASRIRPRELF